MKITQLFSRDQRNAGYILSELTWYDRSPLVPVLEANRGKWIHFSNVPKLGVHVKSMWRNGPHGVYFYPVDYLLTQTRRMVDGLQYGFDFKYYFICDLDLTMSGIDLDTITYDQARTIAEANGWLEHFDDEIEFEDPYIGTSIWNLLRRITESKDISWNKALRGVAYVLDRSGIIYGQLEKEQIVVMNPRVIKNTKLGSNLDTTYNTISDAKSWREFMRRTMEVFQKQFGGNVIWKRATGRQYRSSREAPSLPSLAFELNGKSFEISFIDDSWSGLGIRLSYTFGRENDQSTYYLEKMRDRPFSELVQVLSMEVQEITKLDSDLRFDPFISEDDLKTIITDRITRNLPDISFKTDIVNSDYTSLSVTAHSSREYVFGTTMIDVGLTVSSEDITGYIKLTINGVQLLHSTTAMRKTSVDTLVAELAADIQERLPGYRDLYGPDAPGYGFKFQSDEQWEAFEGWIASESGLYLDGLLLKAFGQETDLYRTFEGKDALFYRIEFVFR